MLLTLSEDTTTAVSRAIDKVAVLAKATSKSRDVTFGFGPETGLTVHCNPNPLIVAAPALERQCQAKKYAQRATTWFGLLVNPGDGAVSFGIGLDFPWKHDDSLEDTARSFRPAVPFEKLDELMERAKKIGRNDPCRCGSRLKYKRCCLQRV
jgi:SEC-C motif